MNTLEAFNRSLFSSIDATPATPHWLIEAALLIANNAFYILPLLLITLWLFGDAHRRESAVRACCVALLALGINQLIGWAWPHPRPFMIGLGNTFMAHAPDASFPSDHGTVFASVAMTLLMARLWRHGSIALIVGVAIAWARVFVGVHFPFDMIGAVIVACLTYALAAPLWMLGGDALTRILVLLYRKLLAKPIDRGWLMP
jgi:undecaprenyl-diphosphatase